MVVEGGGRRRRFNCIPLLNVLIFKFNIFRFKILNFIPENESEIERTK